LKIYKKTLRPNPHLQLTAKAPRANQKKYGFLFSDKMNAGRRWAAAEAPSLGVLDIIT